MVPLHVNVAMVLLEVVMSVQVNYAMDFLIRAHGTGSDSSQLIEF
jgi:hypothetical protein